MIFKTKEKLVKNLIKEGYLKSEKIIDAFLSIDRANFVSDEHKKEAYANYPLPIGQGQTISQPLVVAFMIESLEPKKGEKVLDVGSGSGWQTALLAYIISDDGDEQGKVVAIERIPELIKMTKENISKYGFLEKGIVKIKEGDGSRGFKTDSPYDKIIAAAASRNIPQAWKAQLKIGGRIVAPVGNSIHILDKKEKDKFLEKRYFGFNFVPLIGEGDPLTT